MKLKFAWKGVETFASLETTETGDRWAHPDPVAQAILDAIGVPDGDYTVAAHRLNGVIVDDKASLPPVGESDNGSS
jgi:hypothetical protein